MLRGPRTARAWSEWPSTRMDSASRRRGLSFRRFGHGAVSCFGLGSGSIAPGATSPATSIVSPAIISVFPEVFAHCADVVSVFPEVSQVLRDRLGVLRVVEGVL